MRRLSAALVAVLVVTVLAGFAPPASAVTVTYIEPVTGRVTDPFRAPTTPYGPGNRGLTYATRAGSPARASAPGRVTFAGRVGGALHVVVRHADGVRTSYSFLTAITARVGQTVKQGDVIGSTGESFHFGARIGDAYVDPAILLAGGPARVHLIPDGEFKEEATSTDAVALWRVAMDRAGVVASSAVDWARWAGDESAAAAGWMGSSGVAAVRAAAGDLAAIGAITLDAARFIANATEAEIRAMATHLVTILDEIVNLGEFAGPFAALAAGLADILDAFIEPCTSADVEPPKPPPTRIAVFVAGLGSKSLGPADERNLSWRFRDLGYEKSYDFSYRGGRNPQPYQPEDTVRDLRLDAADLRELLDQIEIAYPDATVDLIAHSQGGLIAREALAERYDGPGRALPSIAHVVTVGTPHHGTDAATALAWQRWSEGGRALRAYARRIKKPFDLTGAGPAQLSETSDFIQEINDRPLRPGVSYTSIAAARDLVVPAPRARLRGATNVLVDAGRYPWQSHSALTTSASARREIQLAVADAPPMCQSVATTAARALEGVNIANAEGLAGAAAAVVGRIATPQP